MTRQARAPRAPAGTTTDGAMDRTPTPVAIGAALLLLAALVLWRVAPLTPAARSGGLSAARGQDHGRVGATRPTFYVSRSGDNRDGRTWATAWNEFDQVRWSELEPGSTLVIDGGRTPCPSNYDFVNHAVDRPGLQCGMLYRTPLVVQVSGARAAPLTIRLASEPGRDGTVVIFGGRQTMLPYCDQQDYDPIGGANAAGIAIRGRSNILVDGRHRSGIMIYGALTGVDLLSDATSFVTLRNLEIFDNGIAERWSYGWKSDNPGVWLAGHDITIDRDLIHDNGQDEIQDGYTGAASGHAPLADIAITQSWLYGRRGHPLWPGYGFNAGSQDVAWQDCTHADGLQIWGGGLHQRRLDIQHDVFGPLLAQGVYPGDQDVASFDDVVIANTLFVNLLAHSVAGDPVAADPSTPGRWIIDQVTSYMTRQPTPGMRDHGGMDLAGAGHVLINSIFQNGYFSDSTRFASARGNLWSGGEPAPGGANIDPQFAGPLPATNAPTYAQLVAADFTPRCARCAGKGASLHRVGDLLEQIDALNAVDP